MGGLILGVLHSHVMLIVMFYDWPLLGSSAVNQCQLIGQLIN